MRIKLADENGEEIPGEEGLVESVTKLLNQLSVDDKQRENRRNQSRERSSSRVRWGDNRRDRGQQQEIVGSTTGAISNART